MQESTGPSCRQAKDTESVAEAMAMDPCSDGSTNGMSLHLNKQGPHIFPNICNTGICFQTVDTCFKESYTFNYRHFSISIWWTKETKSKENLQQKQPADRFLCSPCLGWPQAPCSSESPHMESSWNWFPQSWPGQSQEFSKCSLISLLYYWALGPGE